MGGKRVAPLGVFLTLVLMAISFATGTQLRPVAATGVASLKAEVAGPSSTVAPQVQSVSLSPVETFQEVLSKLRQKYVTGISPEEEKKLAYAAVRGMLYGLGDPYTRFMDPEEYRGFVEENSGHFEGIGATLEMAEVKDPVLIEKDKQSKDSGISALFKCPICGADWVNPTTYRITRSSAKGFEAEYVQEPHLYRHYRITVITPIHGGPAEKAGIKAGDQIVKINDASTFGMGLSEAVKLIKGPANTTVTLLISRKGKNIEFKIVRNKIEIPTVETKALEGGIGYLRINTFNGNSSEKTAEGIADFQKNKAKGILLDLRNNPGGGLEACLDVAAQFLARGPIVHIESRGGQEQTLSVPSDAHSSDLPLVVLVNRASASASEILAGALQDSATAKLVGERTFGKGLVQTVLGLKDNSAVVITTARYFTPKHHQVNEKGITPDQNVEQPEGIVEFLSDKDLQAKAAEKLLKEEIAAHSKTQAKTHRVPVLALAN